MNYRKIEYMQYMYKGTLLTINAETKNIDFSLEVFLEKVESIYQESINDTKEKYEFYFNKLDISKAIIDCGFINIQPWSQLCYFTYIYILINRGKLKQDKLNYYRISYY